MTWCRHPRADRHKLRANVRGTGPRLAAPTPNAPPALYQNRLAELLAGVFVMFGENSRVRTDDQFVQEGIVRPAREFVFAYCPLGELGRHNLLVALGSGDFRTYLALACSANWRTGSEPVT